MCLKWAVPSTKLSSSSSCPYIGLCNVFRLVIVCTYASPFPISFDHQSVLHIRLERTNVKRSAVRPSDGLFTNTDELLYGHIYKYVLLVHDVCTCSWLIRPCVSPQAIINLQIYFIILSKRLSGRCLTVRLYYKAKQFKVEEHMNNLNVSQI